MHWHLLGAGNLGTLAAFYFGQAGFAVRLAGRSATRRRLTLPDGTVHDLQLAGDDNAPITHLVLATKAAQSLGALAPLRARLNADTTLIRLQNGLGSLDGLPAPSPHIIEAIANSGAWREALPGGGEHVHLAAQNPTLFGDGHSTPPDWFAPTRRRRTPRATSVCQLWVHPHQVEKRGDGRAVAQLKSAQHQHFGELVEQKNQQGDAQPQRHAVVAASGAFAGFFGAGHGLV